MKSPFRFALFAVVLAGWTYLLLIPHPVPSAVLELLWLSWMKFLLSKSLHFGMYAGLTWLGGGAVRKPRWIIAFMILHGIGTEIGQMYVPNRDGNVRDVAIDAAGVLTGAWLGLRRAARRQPAVV